MGFKSSLLLASSTVLLATAPAFATTFTFDSNYLPGSDAAGKTKSITTTFNSNTDVLTWSSTFERNANGALPKGAWLVLNDGPNPKGVSNELAIYYLDAIEKKVSIYNYNGANNSKSWQVSDYLGSTDLAVSNADNDTTFKFALDLTDINGLSKFGPEWKGTSFNDNIGIWFHGAADTDKAAFATSYKENGALSNFSYGTAGWYDAKDLTTTAVPEPASAAAIGLFAAAAAFVKRAKQSA